jgi:hypothetical protein
VTHLAFWIATIAIHGQPVASEFVAMAVAFIGSHLFSVLIERRAHAWARSIYRPKQFVADGASGS